ncbi:Proline/sodium symporter PutP TC 2.A.21.2.1 Propionate/sodium symporter [Moraxella catarrhalis]|nr:Proline/sodium symporter PutP TC 2.A.21.2.1 Propionate/sodium symporter [Moraxella catarrhalis]
MQSVETGVWISLAVYFILMIAIGIYAYFNKKMTLKDICLADAI